MLPFFYLVIVPFAVINADHGNTTSKPTLNLLDLAKEMGLTSYLSALKDTGSLNILTNSSGLTVFAPTNEAFLAVDRHTRHHWDKDAASYQQLMRYHILNQRKDRADLKDELVFETLAGHGLTGRFINYDGYSKNVQLYNDAEISSFDHEATNGVIHTLNNVVGHIQSGTLLDIAKEREELSEILKAIDAAGLTDLLTGAIPASTPLTFAAPTNDAIKKLPGGTWDALLNNRTQLTDVLQYHFASAGTWMTRGLVDKLKVETLNKKANWTVSFDSQNAIKIDDASIVFGDLSATNGVVHIIDGVLLPHPKTNR